MPTFIDDLGHVIHLKSYPQRIVSLVPSISLTIFDLGEGSRLVGKTKYCIEPSPETDTIPIVGGTKKVDVEKILQLKPDIVLGNKEENTREMYELIQPHVPFWTCEVSTLPDNARMIQQLGEMVEQPEKAEAINLAIQSSFQSLSSNVFHQKSALYFIWKDPFLSVGGDTFIHTVLTSLGITNVTSHYLRYPDISNIMKSFNPDLILLSSEPYPFTQKHVTAFEKIFPKSQILLVDGRYFSWFGSKMKDAAAYFLDLMN